MEIVRINISAMKFDEMTVTFHCRAPKKPTIINMEEKQLIKGNATHFKFLNTIHKINIMNAKTPNPKMAISFLIKVIISSAIIGIPLSLIVAD